MPKSHDNTSGQEARPSGRHISPFARRQIAPTHVVPASSPDYHQFTNWRDYAAGIKLIEDHRNGRAVLLLNESPSEAARMLLVQHGFFRDQSDQDCLWCKPMSTLHHPEERDDAVKFAALIANAIRHEKGLQPRQAQVGRS
jgi:hypothetical protein